MQDQTLDNTTQHHPGAVGHIEPIVHQQSRVRRKRSIEIQIFQAENSNSKPAIRISSDPDRAKTTEIYFTPKEQTRGLDSEKQVFLFRQLPESSKLLQSIPLQFRKKVREVIKLYEDQRRNYEIALRKFQKSLVESNERQMKLSKKSERTAPSYELETERNTASIDIESGLGGYEAVERHQIFNNEEMYTKINYHSQFLKEGFEQLEINYLEEIGQLKLTIRELQEKIDKQNQGTLELAEQIKLKDEEIQLRQGQIRDLEEANKQLDKTVFEKQKSFRQKRIERMEERNPGEVKLTIPALSVITTRNLSLTNNRSSLDISPYSPVRQRKASLREELKKSRTFMFSRKEEEEMSNSDCESIDFGKEKVVEKRKLRKIFAHIVEAKSDEEKREGIERLTQQIGLRMKDVNFIFNTK